MLCQQTLRKTDRVVHRAGTAAVDVPGDEVQRLFVRVAEVQQRRKNRRLDAGQRRAADARIWISPQNGGGGVLIITRVAVGLESIRTAAALADVRLVGDFPIASSGPALLVVTHQIENKLLPLR